MNKIPAFSSNGIYYDSFYKSIPVSRCHEKHSFFRQYKACLRVTLTRPPNETNVLIGMLPGITAEMRVWT